MRAAESQASTAGFPTPRGGIPAHCVTLGVVYCTGNAGKFREASHVFDEWNASGSPLKVAYLQMDADPVEIQGTDEEVCRAKVEAATKKLCETNALDDVANKCPHAYERCHVVTEDVGLELGCLNGFPGVYCKPMLEAVGDDGLWDLVRRYDDNSARVTCNLGCWPLKLATDGRFVAPDGVSSVAETFVGALEGSIGPPRGDVKHGATSWNSVFTPTGHARTFGEMPFEVQATFSHRRQAIMKYLTHMQDSMLGSLA